MDLLLQKIILIWVIYKYGEESKSKIIAKRIVESRKKSKIDTTYKLSNIIEGISGIKNGVKKHPATKSFQAIRIAINNELNNLVFGLYYAYDVLKVGGYFAIITFHSLEDRITARQIEAARRAITRYIKRGGNIWIRIFPDKPITKKPLEVRMGKGKGNVEYWIFQIDADELPHESLIINLKELLKLNPTVELFLVPRVNTVDGITQEHINSSQNK